MTMATPTYTAASAIAGARQLGMLCLVTTVRRRIP
jgi:hypothetical protein